MWQAITRRLNRGLYEGVSHRMTKPLTIPNHRLSSNLYMKYFSDFSISHRRGILSMARVSGLKATKVWRSWLVQPEANKDANIHSQRSAARLPWSRLSISAVP